MSKADEYFKDMCRNILATENQKYKVRPHWEDGTQAYVIKNFGICTTYDLREEFPAITIRKTGIKSAVDEILWIYQRKSNNIHDLHSTIWDEWASKDGSIGKAYGYQVGKKSIHFKLDKTRFRDDEYIKSLMNMYEKYPSMHVDTKTGEVYMDQMDAVLYDLANDPYSRRIMTNLWNVEELHEMNLQPCAYSCTFNVCNEEGYDKPVLNLLLNQRSQDILAANNWNVVQYSVLLMIVAQVSNMIPGKLMHVISDSHIYDRHIPIIKELIERPEHKAPIVKLNPEIKNFYEFTVSDIIIEDYETEPQIKDIPIAI